MREAARSFLPGPPAAVGHAAPVCQGGGRRCVARALSRCSSPRSLSVEGPCAFTSIAPAVLRRCGLRALRSGGRCSGPGSACPCCAASLVLSVSHAKSQNPLVCPMPLSWPTEAAAVHSAWSGSQAGVRWELRGGQMDKA